MKKNIRLLTLVTIFSIVGNTFPKPFITIDGKTVLTAEEFNKEKNERIEKSEYIKKSYETNPAEFIKNMSDRLVRNAIIEHWAKKNNIENLKEFKKQLEEIIHNSKRMLNYEFFIKQLPLDAIQVSEEEMRAEYEKIKKEDPSMKESFAEAKEMLEWHVKFQKEKAIREQKFEELTKEYNVVVDEAAVK